MKDPCDTYFSPSLVNTGTGAHPSCFTSSLSFLMLSSFTSMISVVLALNDTSRKEDPLLLERLRREVARRVIVEL